MKSAVSLAGASIVVADSDIETMKLLGAPLFRAGFDIRFATTSKEAIRFSLEPSVEMVIAGTAYPDMDGFALTMSITESRDLPVLFMAKRNDVFSVTRAFHAGAVDYLLSPFDEEELLVRVRTHLELGRSRDELKRKFEELDAAYKRLEIMSRTDLLTGVANRKDMMERLELEISRSNRNGTPFSVILADIDDLRDLNDRYGRPAGDYVLVTVTSIMRGLLRSHDSIARWGDDSFLLLLPETPLSGAENLADKLSTQISSRSFDLGQDAVNIRLSCGSAQADPDMKWVDVVSAADRAREYGRLLAKGRTSGYGG